MEFVAGDQAAEGLQPADGSFNDPAAVVEQHVRKPWPPTDVEAIFDLGLVDIDAQIPTQEGDTRTIDLVSSKSYAFECRCRRPDSKTWVPKGLTLYIDVNLGQGEGTIGTASLYKSVDAGDDQTVAYRGVLEPLNRSGDGRLRLRARDWILEQDVVIHR